MASYSIQISAPGYTTATKTINCSGTGASVCLNADCVAITSVSKNGGATASGCNGVAEFTVVLSPTPSNATVTTHTVTCTNSSVSIVYSGTSNNSYYFTVTTPYAGSFSCTGTLANSCSSKSVSFTLTASALTPPSIGTISGGGSFSNCSFPYSPTTLSATSDPGTAGGAGNLTWYKVSGSSNLTINSSSGAITANGAGTAYFNCYRTNNCGTSYGAQVEVSVSQSAGPSAPSLTGCCIAVGGYCNVGTATSYQSSDENVVVMDAYGYAYGVGVGSATITAYNSNECGTSSPGTCTVTVCAAVSCSSMTGPDTIQVGQTATYTLNATNAGTYYNYTDRTSVARVTAGSHAATVTVSGVSAGTARILMYAFDGCGSGSCYKYKDITVSDCVALTGASIAGTTSTSSAGCSYSSGQTLSLTASYGPNTATNVSGPVWSSANSNIATVSNGTVTFKTTGSTTIYAVYSNNCSEVTGSTTVTNTFTQYTSPSVSAPTGSSYSISNAGCAAYSSGQTLQLTAVYTAGTHPSEYGYWSSSNENIATVNSSGLVTFKSTGSVTIYYTRTGGCATSSDGRVVSNSYTQYTSPSVSSVSTTGYSGAGCAAFSSATGKASANYTAGTYPSESGSWSITGNATIDASGNITFNSTGTFTVTYTRTGCSTSSASATVTCSYTQYSSPSVSSVSTTGYSGAGCAAFSSATGKASASYTAGTHPSEGGSWSISPSGSGNATIDASGNITFYKTGTFTVTYTRSGGCATASKSADVTCSYTQYSSPSVSSVSTTGYSGAGCAAFSSATGKASASYTAGTHPSEGGSWSISPSGSGNATIDSSGNITFYKTGTFSVTYTRSGGCATASKSANVACSYTQYSAPSSVSVTGDSGVSSCSAPTLQLGATYNAGTGPNGSGSWSSSNTNVATVNSSGLVTFVAANTDVTITYTRSNDCGSASGSKAVKWTQYTPPSSVSVTGNSTVSACTICGQTIQLGATYNAGTGPNGSGSWSSSDTNVATVNSSGLVTFKTSGSTTITYTRSNDCGSASGSKTVTGTQYTQPYSTGSPYGPGATGTCFCVGSRPYVRIRANQGTGPNFSSFWSSSDTNVATVTERNWLYGEIIPVGSGTVTITLTASNDCGTVVLFERTYTIYNASSPVSISGGGVRVNAGSGVTLTGTSPQNAGATTTWEIIDGTGTLSTSTGTSTVATVTNTNSSITVRYTVNEPCSCGRARATATVYSYGQISDGVSVSCSGGGTICCGSTATIVGTITNDVNASLTKSFSSNNSNLPVNASSGVVSGNAANQSATITCTVTDSYGNSTTCTQTVATYPSVASVSISGGGGSTCCGSTVTLTGSYTNGISLSSVSWTSNNSNVVVQSSGNTSATIKFNAANQTATITYTVTSCDGVSKSTTTTVYSYPSVASVSISGGGGSTCCGSTVTLTGSYTNGISLASASWASNNANVVVQSSGNTSATIKFNAAGQTATITYTVKSCDNVEKSTTTTVYSYPSVASATIGGDTNATLCTGGTASLTGSYTSGISLKSVTWTSSNANFTLSNTGNTSCTVTATSGANGSSTTITYTVTSCDNVSKSGTTTIYCRKNLASTSLGNPSNSVIYGGGSCSTTTLAYSYSPTDTTMGSTSLVLSDTSVASISYPAGTSGIATITGIQNVSAASSVVVTATYTVTDYCGHSIEKTKTFSVRQHVTAATLDITSRTLCAGANESGYNSDVTLTAGFAPANAHGISYSWATSDSSVASISTSTGGSVVVHGIKKGTATITLTATDGCGTSVTKTCAITVKNPNLTCLSAANVTVTCGSTASYTVEASPRKNVGNETTESIVNVTGWTASVTNGVDGTLGQGSINIAKTDKSGTFKGLTHGTGTTISITGQTVGLSDVTVTATDDNGVSKTIVFRVLTKSTAVEDSTKIATRGWINTYRWPIFGSGEDLKKVPRKTDIVTAAAVGTLSGYLSIGGTYEDTQGVKESDISVSMSSNSGKPSGDVC